MKKSAALLCLVLSLWFTETKAQVPSKTKIMYAIPGANLTLGIPDFNEVNQDHLDLGPYAELLKTGLWLQKGAFGLIPEIGMLYYSSRDLNFVDWFYENATFPNRLQGKQLNWTPFIALSASYQIWSSRRYTAHLFGGLVYRTRRWRIDNTDFVSSGSVARHTDDHIINDLFTFETEMVNPFLHYRIGASLLRQRKFPINFRLWADIYPPYDFEYSLTEISSEQLPTLELSNRSKWFYSFGFSAQLYGVFRKRR